MLSPEDTRVLVVEDNLLDRKLLNAYLTNHGYTPRMASHGAEAWAILEGDPGAFDVVLVDRAMPVMGGIELLGRMKEHRRLRMVPVILQTASGGRDDVVEGLRAGAHYYLTKPYDAEMLAAVVNTAANDYAEYREMQEQLRKGLHSLRLLREASFSLQTVAQARDVAAILASATPDPDAAVVGLTELLLNAIEHGNLGITYEEKSRLDTREEWAAEVDRRLTLPENDTKRVEIRFERDADEMRFIIRDEGIGFDWKRFLEIDPHRAFHTHGRGIVMARTLSFTNIEYRGNGSEVVARIALKPRAPRLTKVVATVVALTLILGSGCGRNEPPVSPSSSTASSANVEGVPGTQPAPPAVPAEITIEEPRPGQTIRANPIMVRGRARTFENNVVVRLRDSAGGMILERFTTARGEMGQHNPFEIEMFVTRDPGPRITIEALEYSAKDGSERSVARASYPFAVPLIEATFYLHDPGRAPNDCSQTFPTVRKIPKSKSAAKLMVEALLSSEQFLPGSQLRSINFRSGVLTVDFNERLQNVGGSCRAQALRASIERTLGTLPGVRKVEITAGGSKELALQP